MYLVTERLPDGRERLLWASNDLDDATNAYYRKVRWAGEIKDTRARCVRSWLINFLRGGF